MYDQTNYQNVSRHMLDSLDRYARDKLPPGGFLQSVLENDLAGALGRADHINRHVIHDIVMYVYNELPGPCWGSPEAYQAWPSDEDPLTVT